MTTVDLPPIEGLPGAVLLRQDPFGNAETWLGQAHMLAGKPIVLRTAVGDLYRWRGDRWGELFDKVIEAAAGQFLNRALVPDKNGNLVPFMPNSGHVRELINALGSLTQQSEELTPPCWLNEAGTHDLGQLIPMQNGILNIESGELIPHTPDIFYVHCLPYPYQPEAACPHWHAFLTSIWSDDPESIGALQEWLGLQLVPDIRFHVMMWLIGAKGGGKSTILEVMRQLVGEANVAALTLRSLGERFGLANIAGKLSIHIADVPDNALTPATRGALLNLAGADTMQVERKHKDAFSLRPTARITVASNRLPSFHDDTEAAVRRFRVLKFTRSFVGHEDRGLEAKLAAERAGIFVWALEGLRRLQARGRVLQTVSGQADLDSLKGIISPMSVFVQEFCEIGAGYMVDRSDFHRAYTRWLQHEGHPEARVRQIGKQSAGQDLAAYVPTVKANTRPVIEGQRVHVHQGVRLNEAGRKLAQVFDLSDETYPEVADILSDQPRPSRAMH